MGSENCPFSFVLSNDILFFVRRQKGVTMSSFLTYEDRLTIAAGLKEGKSFKAIGDDVGKDRTTIAKEVKKYSADKKSGKPGYSFNDCLYRKNCKVKRICKDSCTRSGTYGAKCSVCGKCISLCPNYRQEICQIKTKPPYVCNGCQDLDKCTLLKRWYDPGDAQLLAEKNISESRSGILTNEKDLRRLNEIISPLIRKGQSVHQIYLNHVDELMCCEKTIYNYIDGSLLDVRNIDLPRKVRYRARSREKVFKVDRGCRIGRTYTDYQKFMSKEPGTQHVEMDSVIGSVGGKVLLTIHFVSCSFMIALLRDANTSRSVIDCFDDLYQLLGREDFKKLFPVILTDNGSEFSNPKGIEFGPEQNDARRTWIFYCDAGKPYQKGAIEVNHELIRRVLPKGTSFDNFTQQDINLVMSHINSYKRKKLNDHSPYETFSFLYGEGLAEKLGIVPVAAENIVLKPRLLKK